jgi:hypothetical protein
MDLHPIGLLKSNPPILQLSQLPNGDLDMTKYEIPKYYKLNDLPEYKRFQQANPGKDLDAIQAAIMFGRAIHWLSISDILWPDFGNVDYFSIEVMDIVYNDPDRPNLPIDFYNQIAELLAMFWKIKLTDLYPGGDWDVTIHNDPELTVDAFIRKR